VSFYKKFPNFLAHDLYISGESYAGIYVPYLAWQIDTHNAMYPADQTITYINLKGFLVGNGCTDFTIDGNNAMVPTLYGFHIIPEDLYNDYNSNNCNFTIRNCIPTDRPPVCDKTMIAIEKLIGGLNIYDFFRPVYPTSALKEAKPRLT
jgi:serine carboxypeptidase-like clade 1